ncbi:hypothetical protein K505DRAFT_346385 [Melanomma pulvis-pyrius CBS 109.77]|uniref:Rhodopsin domain-containing protein n=1 Tax=Melanomma pulvis-pyrius CBS 109.77 TaxID=1314802 RepID=A0A6A6XQ75_9PLEO|nr:hypothetical protein K505DRAFT_346385 [Melanomma pulvis-pyrius CBS 109.77]
MPTTPSLEFLAESRQADLYAAVTITYVGALVAVALRFWSRKLKGTMYWLDDWLIAAAQVCATAMLVNIVWWVSRGYGKHREASGPEIDHDFFLGFFMAEIIYTFILTFVKYAILALYWRIFGKEAIQWPVYILAFVATAWAIAVLFLSIFTCVPPNAFWDKSVKNPHCGVDNKMFLWGISIPNIITDVSLLLLPIPYVFRLSTSWSQKRLLLSTFFLGGFVCIASIMRLVSVVRQNQGPDAPWHWVDQGLWAITEGHFAIISACLPALRPVWIRLFQSSQSKSEPTTGRTPHIWTIGGSGPSSRKRSHKVVDESLLLPTVDDSTHPFQPIPDTIEAVHETIYAPEQGVLTTRATLEGYELNQISKGMLIK